jgi:hypothetical protein
MRVPFVLRAVRLRTVINSKIRSAGGWDEYSRVHGMVENF